MLCGKKPCIHWWCHSFILCWIDSHGLWGLYLQLSPPLLPLTFKKKFITSPHLHFFFFFYHTDVHTNLVFLLFSLVSCFSFHTPYCTYIFSFLFLSLLSLSLCVSSSPLPLPPTLSHCTKCHFFLHCLTSIYLVLCFTKLFTHISTNSISKHSLFLFCTQFVLLSPYIPS